MSPKPTNYPASSSGVSSSLHPGKDNSHSHGDNNQNSSSIASLEDLVSTTSSSAAGLPPRNPVARYSSHATRTQSKHRIDRK
ncbi:hypothetical protein Ciccas_002413 [Cichlidogyrus casuarinus]|uniref:Uncharacterized protein n=1 Tax=Cichlidogyrus casuarinus TaxID=1844966 RepID=A0ABD2QKH4_9PLAT